MTNAFPEAWVEEPERFLPVVPPGVHPSDRHVVAAALAARADGIVTQNVNHFPRAELASLGIELQSLDEFLVNQLTLASPIVLDVVAEMAVDRQRSPKTPDELLAALEPHAPGFVAQIRASRGWACVGSVTEAQHVSRWPGGHAHSGRSPTRDEPLQIHGPSIFNRLPGSGPADRDRPCHRDRACRGRLGLRAAAGYATAASAGASRRIARSSAASMRR